MPNSFFGSTVHSDMCRLTGGGFSKARSDAVRRLGNKVFCASPPSSADPQHDLGLLLHRLHVDVVALIASFRLGHLLQTSNLLWCPPGTTP
eukprot:5589752-Amphidinium_carterae.1